MRMDITPLRSRDFRLLFLAGTVFYLGAMVTYVAIPYQIYTLTGSNFAVGAIGLVELVPLVVFGLYGGALADHVDRRRLLIGTGLAQAVFTAVLAVNAFRDDPNVPLIFVVAGFLAASSSMQRPSREALMPRTVQHDQIVAANSLTSFGMQVGVLVGPMVGGLLVAYVGIGWCFVVDICGLAIATLLFVAMRPYPHRDRDHPAEPGRDPAGADVRALAPRPARHLPRRHRRDVAGDAGRAVPGAGRGGLRPARDPRAALLRRDRRRPARHRAQRLDRPDPPPRPGDRDRRRGVRRASSAWPA